MISKKMILALSIMAVSLIGTSMSPAMADHTITPIGTSQVGMMVVTTSTPYYDRDVDCSFFDSNGVMITPQSGVTSNLKFSDYSGTYSGNFSCKYNLGSGAQSTTYNSANNPLGAGTLCGYSTHDLDTGIVRNYTTSDWSQTIKPNGDTTLKCNFSS